MGVPDLPERATEQIKQACVLSTGTGSRKSSANAFTLTTIITIILFILLL